MIISILDLRFKHVYLIIQLPMKRPVIILLFLSLAFTNARSQFHLSSSEQFFITAGDSLHFDGLTLTPSSNFTISNTTLTKNSAVTNSSVSSTIARAYRFSNAITGFTGSAKINYIDAELNSIPEDKLQMIIYNGTSWQPINTASSDATNNFLIGNAINNMTISELTLANALSILPVRMLSFNGSLTGETILLQWSTASEMNAREFIIEHSIDRTKWSAIGRVKAKGNGNSVNTYSFEHVTPALGYNFYRLIAVDIDGRTNKTQVIQITNAIKPMPLQVYPNPVTNGAAMTVMVKAATVD